MASRASLTDLAGEFRMGDHIGDHVHVATGLMKLAQTGQQVTVRAGEAVYHGRVKEWTRDLYNSENVVIAMDPYIDDSPTKALSTAMTRPIPTSTPEEEIMEYPQAHVVRVKSRRAVNIHIEIEENVFLAPNDDGERITREPGQEMPMYASLPEEYFLPILRAANAEYAGVLPR